MSAMGRVLIRQNRVMALVHRLLHRKRDEACFVCRAAWAYLVTIPGFQEDVNRGEAQMAAGQVVRWDDLRGTTSCNVDHGGGPCSWEDDDA